MDRDREGCSRQPQQYLLGLSTRAGGNVFVPPKYSEQRIGTNVHLSSKSLAFRSVYGVLQGHVTAILNCLVEDTLGDLKGIL